MRCASRCAPNLYIVPFLFILNDVYSCWTELQNAILKGDENCLQQLLQNRASVDATDRSSPNLWSVPSCHVLTMAAMSAWVLDVVCLVYAKAGQPYTWPPTRSPDQAT